MTRTITVEGRGTAVDTNNSMTNQGEESAPSRDVPIGAKKIDKIVGSIIADGLADGSGVFILKLSEGGISGTQILVVGAQGAKAVTSGADGANAQGFFLLEDVDIKVTENKQITIEFENVGDDLGDTDAAITLIFD